MTIRPALLKRYFILGRSSLRPAMGWLAVRFLLLMAIAGPQWVKLRHGQLTVFGEDRTRAALDAGTAYYVGLFFNEMYGWIWLFFGFGWAVGYVLMPLARSYLPSETLWLRVTTASPSDLAGPRYALASLAVAMSGMVDLLWIATVKLALPAVEVAVLIQAMLTFLGALAWACGIVMAAGSLVGFTKSGTILGPVIAILTPCVSGLMWWGWLRDKQSWIAKTFPVGTPFLGGFLDHWQHHAAQMVLGIALILCQLIATRSSHARYR
jgi:hypothetical protein